MSRSPDLDVIATSFGRQLVLTGAMVLHLQTGVYGQVKGYHPPGTYRGRDGSFIDEHVLELDAGTSDGNGLPEVHALLMRPAELAHFYELNAVEWGYLESVSAELRALLVHAVGAAKATEKGGQPIRMGIALMFIGLALQAQLRVLQSAVEEGSGG